MNVFLSSCREYESCRRRIAQTARAVQSMVGHRDTLAQKLRSVDVARIQTIDDGDGSTREIKVPICPQLGVLAKFSSSIHSGNGGPPTFFLVEAQIAQMDEDVATLLRDLSSACRQLEVLRQQIAERAIAPIAIALLNNGSEGEDDKSQVPIESLMSVKQSKEEVQLVPFSPELVLKGMEDVLGDISLQVSTVVSSLGRLRSHVAAADGRADERMEWFCELIERSPVHQKDSSEVGVGRSIVELFLQ